MCVCVFILDGGQGKAFLSVVIADLEDMRLGFSPRLFGFDYTQVVYRAIVRAPNGERGVYFVRSDATDTCMSAAGSLFSNFNFDLCDALWGGLRDNEFPPLKGTLDVEEEEGAGAGTGRASRESTPLDRKDWLPSADTSASAPLGQGSSPTVKRGQHEPQHVHFMLEPWADADAAAIRASFDVSSARLVMPEYSAFRGRSVREAQRYFVELYAAFASWPLHDHWRAVRIDRAFWNVCVVDHVGSSAAAEEGGRGGAAGRAAAYAFMQDSDVFKPGECQLDSVFYVHDLDYHWHVAEKHSFQSRPTSPGVTTMYYDALCPLCVKEVGLYIRLAQRHNSRIAFVDINRPESIAAMADGFGVSLDDCLARLHVVDDEGTLHTGAKAFVQVWRRLPYWRWLATISTNVPFVLPIAEVVYTQFAKHRAKLSGRPQTAPGASCRLPQRKRGADNVVGKQDKP
jgi:predicted DCC family thiol-disulfide oxidoreductase YuxK